MEKEEIKKLNDENIKKAIKESLTTENSENALKIQTLYELGSKNTKNNLQVLEFVNYDLEKAIEILFPYQK